MPLAETYASDHPFLGVVLEGVFTANSVAQLQSHGFGVLHFPYANIVTAFNAAGVNVAFDESSSDAEVQKKVDACERLSPADWGKVAKKLYQLHRKEFKQFLDALETSLTRRVETIYVIALHGASCETRSIDQAIEFIERHDEAAPLSNFCRYEIQIRYNNQDEVRGSFASKTEAVRFLNTFS